VAPNDPGKGASRVVKVLMDHSVYRRGFFCQMVKQRIQEPISVDVIGWMLIPPSQDGWLRSQTACLPTIGRLSREGKVKLSTSHELWREATRGYMDQRQPGFAFEGCEWEELKLPIERFRLWTLAGDQIWDDEPLRCFCGLLLKPESLLDTLTPDVLAKFSTFELDNMRKNAVFKEICRTLSWKHWPDAFHLWTAEVNGVDFYVTLDKKFKNALSKNQRLSIACETVFPDQLLERQGITERDPLPPLLPGTFYTMGQAYHLCRQR
jgi:hypothetical protein